LEDITEEEDDEDIFVLKQTHKNKAKTTTATITKTILEVEDCDTGVHTMEDSAPTSCGSARRGANGLSLAPCYTSEEEIEG